MGVNINDCWQKFDFIKDVVGDVFVSWVEYKLNVFWHRWTQNRTNLKNILKFEYGPYDNRRESDYDGHVHYSNRKDFVSWNNTQIINETPGNICVECHFENKMTVSLLLWKIHFPNSEITKWANYKWYC